MKKYILLISLISALVILWFLQSYGQRNPMVLMETGQGRIIIELYPEKITKIELINR